MRAIIVDDEPKAIELINSYLEHFNDIEVVQTFRNGLKAFDFLSKESVDLIFLDINMPHISGMSLSKMLGKEIKVIFTTAYSEYAVESYEVNAVDYLLKPISLERFTQSIGKLLSQSKEEKTVEKEDASILVKSGIKKHILPIKEILYLEKDGNYITYYLENQKIVARTSIGDVLNRLPKTFIQVHKSFIINSERISSYDKETIFIKDYIIPIGNTYRSQLKNYF